MKGQGKVRRVEACPGMSGHVPAEGAADKPRRRAGNQADQSGADTKPSPSNQELTRSPWTPITPEPAFSSLYGSPAGAIKPFPTLADSADSLYPADSPCFADPPRFLAYPPPGVLPESDHPIKGPDQRSIGVAPSSHGVSYTFPYRLLQNIKRSSLFYTIGPCFSYSF